mgnify:CR=1 FL=1
MRETKRILVTGATGKVGQTFLRRLFADSRFDAFIIRALCHRRRPGPHERLEIVSGSIEHRAVVEAALAGVTHVVHLASVKQTPETAMDVDVKGLFWLLETCRLSRTFEQFILLGGDNVVGHYHYSHPVPVTENQPYTPTPASCYALSKVLAEVMLKQYYIQYDLNGCCLRAPWIMAQDDFRNHLSFAKGAFGANWWKWVGEERAEEYARAQAVPVMLDPNGEPVKRNFVHVEDVAGAILTAIDHPKTRQQTFHICMNEPVDYRELGNYLAETRGLPTVDVQTPYYSTWLDNSKIKFLLGWRPEYDMKKMADAAWDYAQSR